MLEKNKKMGGGTQSLGPTAHLGGTSRLQTAYTAPRKTKYEILPQASSTVSRIDVVVFIDGPVERK